MKEDEDQLCSPSLAGKHGGESEEDGHGDGQSLGDTVGGQEEC